MISFDFLQVSRSNNKFLLFCNILAKFMPADQPQQPMMMAPPPQMQMPVQQVAPAAPAQLIQDFSSLTSFNRFANRN